MLRTPHSLRSLAAALVATSALLVAAASARADAPGSPGCPTPTFEQPFPNDPAQYVLVPGGSFEDGPADPSQWTGGGTVVTDDNAREGHGTNALSIPAGSSATSPPMCVGLNYPTLRFYARSADASKPGRVTVHVLFRTPDGVSRQLKIADLPAGGVVWQPTRPVYILANLLALFPNWDGQVSFRITASGGAVKVDDVYVDPYER